MKKFALKVFGIGILWFLGLGAFGLMQTQPAYAQSQVQLNQDSHFGDTSQTAGIAVGGAGTNADASIITIIKNFINRTLGILGLIALVILLYGGFQMVTAAGDDDKYKKGFKVLKEAAVGLIFIGLAFFMVSIVLWLISKVWGGASWSEVVAQ